MQKPVKKNLHMKVKSGVKEVLGSWDTAIEDAEREIQTAKQRIAGLKLSIESFKQLRERRASFPGR